MEEDREECRSERACSASGAMKVIEKEVDDLSRNEKDSAEVGPWLGG